MPVFAPRKNLFPPPQLPNYFPRSAGDSQDNQLGNQQPEQTPDDFASRMRQMYNADSSGPAMKAFQTHLSQAPQNKPNFVTSLAATLSGAGAGWRSPKEGALVGQEVLNQPFVRAQEQWKTKGAGLEKAAEIEDRGAKERLGLFKEIDTRNRQVGKDANEQKLNDARIKNYDSLVKEREQGKFEIHEDKTNGHLVGVNKASGERKDYGVVDLTPQQKADLQVSTSGREEDKRQGNRKDMLRFTNPLIQDREEKVHKDNRLFDIANPTPRAGAGQWESIDQQNKAITSAAKELNIEGQGKYSHLFNSDGTLKNPDDLSGGMFSDDKTGELASFYKLAQQRAEEKLSKQRPKTQSTATSYPPVKAPIDPRINR